jgi:hypothetical protein
VLENGSPIGKPHALHDDIRTVGGGLYSHWKDTLYFSTSDNSDPNSNGRSYSLARSGDAAPQIAARAETLQAPALGVAREASGEVESLADILRRRGVRRVVYFHADHFEPWSTRNMEQRWRGLERFMRETRRHAFARRQSLFYTPWLVHALAGKGTENDYRDGDDPVVFRRRSPDFLRGCHEFIRPLETDVGHEFHIHIHHEGWSRTTVDYGAVSVSVNANGTPEADSRRLGFYAGLCREVMAEELGRSIDRWAFVHGNWSLNAADPRSCRIEDEIAVLMKQGCYGDFTFPAGEAKSDPRILEVPYTCRPAIGPKSYDTPQADPRPLQRGESLLTPDRFFVWNSQIKATHSSLDYYDEGNVRLLKAREPLVRAWLEQSVVIDGRLYVKTHAHSMHNKYKPWEDDAWFPHTHPDAVAAFELLQRACDAAGVAFVPATVDEVMAHMRSYDRGEAEPAAGQLPEAAAAAQDSSLGAALAPVKAALLAGMRQLAERPIDSYYASRVERSAVLETYETAVIEHVVQHLPPSQTRLFEVGIGWGMLSICLASLGYEVTGFVGQHDHAEAARRLVALADRASPGIVQRLMVVEDMFPDQLRDDMMAENRQNVMVVTNLVHSFSAANQQRIIEAGLRFDEVLLETGTFGISRSLEEREDLKQRLERLFDVTHTIWQGRITVMKPKASNRTKKTSRAPTKGERQGSLSFPLRRPFTAHGRHGWIAQLPSEFEADADRAGNPRKSQWQVTENGRALEPAHALHADIGELGQGRFSHWTTQLYFSTSDNSDPNTGDRQYALQWTGAEARPEVAKLIVKSPAARPPRPAPSAEATDCKGLIAIFGASFSGSTLINSVLGSHPKIFGGGELHWVVKNPKETVCAICRGECRFWTPQARSESTLQGLYHQVSRRFGRPYVVDISKMREWYEEILPHFPDLPVVRVLLVKHPVRHVSSFIEKKDSAGTLPDGTPAYGTPERALQRLRAFYEGFVLPGEGHVEVKYNLVEKPTPIDFVIRYEDFVASPAKALQPVLERLGVSYEPQMEAWAQAEHHHIGGNIGPRVQINNDVPALASAARKYQQRGIFLDNSFSDILDLETIEAVLYDADSTWMRDRFGYPIADAARELRAQANANARPGEPLPLHAPFAQSDGNAWSTTLPADLAAEADDSVNKYRSPWRLYEDGKPIGAPHALHDDIRNVGRGRHSHWRTQLLFSTADNSNPNTNGRSYAIVRGFEDRSTVKPAAAEKPPEPATTKAGTPAKPIDTALAGRLAEILKRRGVREIVYFHTDHFEPWGGAFQDGIRRLEAFAALTRRSKHGRRLNLFYTPPVGYTLRPSGGVKADQRRVAGDGIVFDMLSGQEADTHRNAIRALVELGHEFHLHIHHTRWTRNSGNADAKLKAWLDEHSSPEADSQRLDLFTELSCQSIADSTGRPFDRWAFIHGLWALNASDTSACLVEDEMAILMRHGCFGDFTFPAGRGHCDPTCIEAPYTCLPAVGPKSYDLPTADPRPLVRGGGHLRPGRFFIWNSPIKAPFSSVDYYHEPNRVLFKQEERLVSEWLEKSVLMEGTLFIKTHSHSLDPFYKIGGADGVNPHLYPDVVALFDLLEKACEGARVELRTLTVSELMDHLAHLDQAAEAA